MKWYIEQLVPRTYSTHYKDEDDQLHFVVWDMWLGFSYNIHDTIVQERQA